MKSPSPPAPHSYITNYPLYNIYPFHQVPLRMPLTDWIPTGYATLMQRLLYKIILIRIFNSLLQFIIVFIKLTFFYSGFKSLFPTFSNGKIPTILFSYLPDMNGSCMYVCQLILFCQVTF